VTYAKIIADSISPDGVRLTTMEVRFHRFVLAEFNTHRVFSRNSASSRAIPVTKQIERVTSDPAMPVSWPAEVKGMQGGAEFEGHPLLNHQSNWHKAATQAVEAAQVMRLNGLHKSLTNRLLEPFMWHTVVVTATAWENFFALRLDADAQPEIRVAAEAMKDAYEKSTPRLLVEGEWHLPYVREEDWKSATNLTMLGRSMYPLMTKVSAARCARTSYLTQDGRRDIEEDLRLYDRLVTDRVGTGKGVHWSPLEHVATPWEENRQSQTLAFLPLIDSAQGGRVTVPTDHLPRVGNLVGWRSLRTEVEATHNERTFA
jgi:thymidylate synthase ThyX